MIVVGADFRPVEHTPRRPGWDCRACDKDWPCDPARESMLLEYRDFPSSLAFYLSSQQADCLSDIPTLTPAELYERFMAWSR